MADPWCAPGEAASLGSDAGHEMTTSLLPTFSVAVLRTGPAALGAIEGVSDALTGLARLAGGPLATDPRRLPRIVRRVLSGQQERRDGDQRADHP